MTGLDKSRSQRLAVMLWMVGMGKLVLAIMILILAVTGYQTTSAVNGTLLLVGINLVLLGGLCLRASRAFQTLLTEDALHVTAKIFGYYVILLALAILGVGYDLIVFLSKIISD